VNVGLSKLQSLYCFITAAEIKYQSVVTLEMNYYRIVIECKEVGNYAKKKVLGLNPLP